MANRFPLVVDSDNLNIKELPSGDTLDLTGSSIYLGTNTITDAKVATWDTAVQPSDDPTFGTVTATSYVDGVYALTGTEISGANGTVQTKTLSADTTFTETLASGESVILMLSGGDTYVVTFPTMTWTSSSGNAAPTLTSDDVVVFWKVNTTLYGAYVGSYANV